MKTNIRNHFSSMLVTLGWAATGYLIVYALVFVISEAWKIMFLSCN